MTELLEGEDLADRLARERKLPVPEAVRIARAVAAALAEAHQRGVLHRDVKPSNVFLTTDGGVKLIDFGVAKLEDAAATLTHAGAFLGTPAYMAPEQAASASRVDERSDIYGLGAVLYHTLSGQPPYGDLDATQTLTRLLGTEPPRLGALRGAAPEALSAILERAMARDPAARHASAEELRRELEPFEHGSPAAVAERDARWLRPRAVAAVLGAALLASAWSTALLVEVGRALDAFAVWPEWALVLYRSVPAAVLVFGLISGVRSLWDRWRSAPRVRALVDGLRRTVWISAATLGAIATLRVGATLYEIEIGLSETELAIAALVGSVLVAATVAAVLARLTRAR